MATGDRAQSGHDAVLAIELDDGAGAVVPDVFAIVAGLNNEISVPKTRNTEDAGAHGDTISSTIRSDLLRMGEIPFAGNFLLASAANQDNLTGLEKHMQTNNTFKVRFQGPNHVVGSTDEIIMSGGLSAFTRTAGYDQAKYSFSATFVPSGTITQDGVDFGVVLQPAQP